MTIKPQDLVVESVRVDELKPFDGNPRVGDVGAISVSLERNGQYRPIVVNRRDNTILAGNHTWKAARSLGWETIAATYVDVDEEQARRIVLVDNRSNDVASYDEHALVDLLTSVVTDEGLDGLLGTGFDGDDLDRLLADLDDPDFGDGDREEPQPKEDDGKVLSMSDVTLDKPAEYDTQMGDVWVIDGKHLLFVVDLFTDHQMWVDVLEPGDVFVPYPEPYITLTEGADKARLVMVAPSPYLAAHVLHRHALYAGSDSVKRRDS